MTDTAGAAPPSAPPEIQDVTFADIRAVLAQGWRDYRAAPAFGLFFSAVYVVAGVLLVVFGAGTLPWTLTVSLGFPLVAPFAAVGLYEVSRRIEAGQPLDWAEVLGVVLREKDRQIPWMGAIIMIYFLFWTFLAHMIFALFMGLSVMTNVSSSLDVFLTPNGLTMIAVEILVGGVFAFVLFALTVICLPMLLDREIDFVTGMITSFNAVKSNFAPMLFWAAVVGVTMIVGMLPVFLGLLVVLPVLGHATWHLYRRAIRFPEP
jgi:uncharacterized membrane protein